MNQLYDAVDGIVSKPGGVTMTECLWKGIPIFVYEALPGQEEFNLRYLSRKGLVTPLQNWHRSADLESQIIAKLKEHRMERSLYFKAWEPKELLHVIEEICKE